MKRYLTDLGILLGLTVVYFWAGKLGLSLAFLNASASAVWPPTGLALAAVLLLGYRVWPAIFIGAFLVNSTTAGSVATSLAIAAGNTLEAVLGAMLARRFAGGRAAFDQAGNIFRFLFFAVIPSTAVSATVGVAVLAWARLVDPGSGPAVWLTWWTGDFVSDLVVAPLLIIWCTKALPRYPLSRIFEAVLLLLTILATSHAIFTDDVFRRVRNYPLEYFEIPLLLWAAFRFLRHGAITAAFLISALAVIGTWRGLGPFAVGNTNDSLLLLQTFIGVITLTSLVLAALLAERRGVEETLRQNEHQLRMALEGGRMGLWQWDIISGKVVWSPGLEEIHGLSPGTFAGTFDAFLSDIHPDDRTYVTQSINKTLEERSDHHIEYRLLLKNGAVRWVQGRGRLSCDEKGNPQRMVGVCMDISAQKRSQIDREELLAREQAVRTEAERANNAKDRFLAVLSHELRTPLTPVLLTASLLESDDSLPAHLREDVTRIRHNVELEARLIDDLLDLTRITRGKLQLQFETTDVHYLIGHAIDTCRINDGVAIHRALNASRHHVKADPARLQQVFVNLIGNAVKFTPAGGTITIRTRNDENGSVIIDVADTGAGIEPGLLPKLFTAFEQGDAAKAHKTTGLGLGLAISKALMGGHGGTLTADSPGKDAGATFTVQLPTVLEVAVPAVPLDDDRDYVSSRALRILLVEDHESTLAVMSKLLSFHEHEVTTATTVAEAIKAAEQETFDLVISDLGLPDGLGFDLMRAVKDKYGLKGIALSGYGMDSDIEKSREAGFVEHLTKPVDLKTLHAAILRATAPEAS